MNKVILMGRLTRDPQVRYTQSGEPMAVAKYSLAVPRRFKGQGETDVDFINCVAFGKAGEFAQKYFKKGQMVSVVGRLQISTWDDKEGKKRTSVDIVIEDQFFAESKASSESHKGEGSNTKEKSPDASEGFYPIDDSIDDEDLPF